MEKLLPSKKVGSSKGEMELVSLAWIWIYDIKPF